MGQVPRALPGTQEAPPRQWLLVPVLPKGLQHRTRSSLQDVALTWGVRDEGWAVTSARARVQEALGTSPFSLRITHPFTVRTER